MMILAFAAPPPGRPDAGQGGEVALQGVQRLRRIRHAVAFEAGGRRAQDDVELAQAIADEIEQPRHLRARFTVASQA